MKIKNHVNLFFFFGLVGGPVQAADWVNVQSSIR